MDKKTIERALAALFPGCQEDPWYPAEALREPGIPTRPSLLNPESIRENALYAGLSEEDVPSLVRCGAAILGHSDLLPVFLLTLHLLIDEPDRHDAHLFKNWPDFPRAVEVDTPLFYLLLALSCVPSIRRVHAGRGISEEITRATCSGIGSKAKDFEFFFNRPGIKRGVLYWFQHSLAGDLYRLGRLEYMLKPVYHGISVYRRRSDGATRLLMNHPDTEEPILVFPDGTFTSGIPRDVPETWDLCLGTEDHALDVHIPGGGKLTLDVIKDSFQRALDFFDTLHPDRRAAALQCFSWIFSPDLEGAYEAGDNLLNFRAQVYRYPVQTGRVDGLGFLFGTDSPDPEDWPEKTRVQRKLKAHLRAGGSFRLSGMVYLREDLEAFGGRPYR
jgi:hypothetical protein